MIRQKKLYFDEIAICFVLTSGCGVLPAATQTLPPTLNLPDEIQRNPQPIQTPKPLPSKIQDFSPVFPPNPSKQPNIPSSTVTRIVVSKFEIVGNTIFSNNQLENITKGYINRPLDINSLLDVATKITELYAKNGYINSVAIIDLDRPFDPNTGIVHIKIIEGKIENIVVTGTKRLNSNYIRSRISLGLTAPLKIERLTNAFQLIQLDPLIKNISIKFLPGSRIGSDIIKLNVEEAPSWKANFSIANNSNPSVGELQRQVSINQLNLLGLGDQIGFTYVNTDGSSIYNVNYALPINPHNGTIELKYTAFNSNVIESSLSFLDINGIGRELSVSYRQPLFQSPSQEFALGLSVSNKESNTGFLQSLFGERIPFPSLGADSDGTIRVSAVKFFQDYTYRDTEQVFFAKSQVSIGLNAFNSSTNFNSSPNSQFVSWRGQAQYVKTLAPDTSFIFKLDTQIADRSLLPVEQIALGGQDTVRGYRQDALLSDNGLLASAEIRFPIMRTPQNQQLLQVASFVDFATVWNKPNEFSPNPNLSTIGSVGVGLRYQLGNNLTARLDYGIPLSSINGDRKTLQENGLYVFVNYSIGF